MFVDDNIYNNKPKYKGYQRTLEKAAYSYSNSHNYPHVIVVVTRVREGIFNVTVENTSFNFNFPDIVILSNGQLNRGNIRTLSRHGDRRSTAIKLNALPLFINNYLYLCYCLTNEI